MVKTDAAAQKRILKKLEWDDGYKIEGRKSCT